MENRHAVKPTFTGLPAFVGLLVLVLLAGCRDDTASDDTASDRATGALQPVLQGELLDAPIGPEPPAVELPLPEAVAAELPLPEVLEPTPEAEVAAPEIAAPPKNRPAPVRLEPAPPSVPAPAAAAPPVTEPAPTATGDSGKGGDTGEEKVRLLVWEDIASFTYEPPDLGDIESPTAEDEANAVASGDAQIPPEVKALEGKLVSIEGFMMPLDVKDGLVFSFVLARHIFGCCFGVAPKTNEWVVVNVKGNGASAVSYDSVLVTGHLKIGGVMDEFGYIYSIYQIEDGTVSARR